MQQQLQEASQQSGLSVKECLIGSGLMMAIPGLLLEIMAILLARARFWVIIVAMVLDGLLILMAAMMILSALVNSGGNPLPCAPFIIAEAIMIAMMSDPHRRQSSQRRAKGGIAISMAILAIPSNGRAIGVWVWEQQPPPGGNYEL